MSERLFVRLEEDPVHGPEASVPAGTLRALPIDPRLRPFVSRILHYRESIPDGQEVLERVLPDGALHVVFNLGHAPTVGEGVGFRVEAVGASARPALVRLRGRMNGFSVLLRPGAAAVLLGVPATALTNTAVPLTDLWRSDATAALERLATATDDRSRARALNDLLVRRVRESPEADARPVARLTGLIAASGGSLSLRVLSEAVGIGERRIQQLFAAHVGLSPRSYGRLARLHACLRALRGPRAPRWADLAVTCGFADQSHLANEFRALCGLAPTEFLHARVSGSSKTTPRTRGTTDLVDEPKKEHAQ